MSPGFVDYSTPSTKRTSGAGESTQRPDDLSRDAFVGDVVAVMEEVAPGEPVTLVGQSMGAHTAFLTAAARPDVVLGSGAIVHAWVEDLQAAPDGLTPRFDADVMERTIAAVHEPRWTEWESLQVPTLAVFAEHGMFTPEAKDALISRRPATERVDLDGGSHDAHLDAFPQWVEVLTGWLARREDRTGR